MFVFYFSVNIEGVHNVIELAKQYNLRIFVPSTIGAFGPDSPRNPTPNITVSKRTIIWTYFKIFVKLNPLNVLRKKGILMTSTYIFV